MGQSLSVAVRTDVLSWPTPAATTTPPSTHRHLPRALNYRAAKITERGGDAVATGI
jgi:hypothetical protein